MLHSIIHLFGIMTTTPFIQPPSYMYYIQQVCAPSHHCETSRVGLHSSAIFWHYTHFATILYIWVTTPVIKMCVGGQVYRSVCPTGGNLSCHRKENNWNRTLCFGSERLTLRRYRCGIYQGKLLVFSGLGSTRNYELRTKLVMLVFIFLIFFIWTNSNIRKTNNNNKNQKGNIHAKARVQQHPQRNNNNIF